MLRQIYTAFFLKLLIELMSEAATKFLGNYLALMNIPNGATVASRSPVPQNQVTSIVADLVSFDLVETSKKNMLSLIRNHTGLLLRVVSIC